MLVILMAPCCCLCRFRRSWTREYASDRRGTRCKGRPKPNQSEYKFAYSKFIMFYLEANDLTRWQEICGDLCIIPNDSYINGNNWLMTKWMINEFIYSFAFANANWNLKCWCKQWNIGLAHAGVQIVLIERTNSFKDSNSTAFWSKEWRLKAALSKRAPN